MDPGADALHGPEMHPSQRNWFTESTLMAYTTSSRQVMARFAGVIHYALRRPLRAHARQTDGEHHVRSW